jgi:hypothetical protein
MSGDSVQLHFGFDESVLNLFGSLKTFVRLQHVIGWLCPSCAGLFGIVEKLSERFAAVLRAFDAGMKTIFGHSRWWN